MEETTEQFAKVQSAYEILSDPQERAWYDTHRNTILHGGDGASGEHYEHNVRITTAEDIMRMFTRFQGKPDFSDSATGFYGQLRETFDNLAREEELACEWEDLDPVTYPSFGHANDNYEEVVKPFYAIWNGFATKKSFSWEDVYRYSEAPDRRVRRMMEKENKRFREESIREFNDAVRSLVAFVKKRDPRFKPNVQTEADRQKVLRDAAIAQAARSRAANKARNAPQPEAVPEWMKSSEAQEESISDESEDAVQEQFECLICKKNFKSEKQYEAHEKSRKHVRAVQHIRRQMQQEDKVLNLDEDNGKQSMSPSKATAVEDLETAGILPESPNVDGELEDTPNPSTQGLDSSGISRKDSSQDSEAGEVEPEVERLQPAIDLDSAASSSEDDEYTTRDRVEDRILGAATGLDSPTNGSHAPEDSYANTDDLPDKLASASLDEDSFAKAHAKVGKAKEKRAKKAAQKSSSNASSETEFKCASCQAGFPSKTQLFNHIKDFGHAQPVQKPAKGGKGKKR